MEVLFRKVRPVGTSRHPGNQGTTRVGKGQLGTPEALCRGAALAGIAVSLIGEDAYVAQGQLRLAPEALLQETLLSTSSKTCSQSPNTPALLPQVFGVGVAGHRRPGVAVGFLAHLLLAPGSGMAA